jgi:hypothetical protein
MGLTNAQRNAIVSNCQWFSKNQSLIGYAQERPFPIYTKTELQSMFNAKEKVNVWDCSASTVEIFSLSGVKDPTGFNYGGFGNTESMLEHLPHYTKITNAHPGALVIFGADLPLAKQHVCIVTKQGANPTLFSHGSAFSCKFLSLSQEQSAHSGTTVFLDVSGL